MQSALDQFRSNILRVRNLYNLHAYFAGVTTSALDLSDLLRTQIVLCVSALDHYVHELTRLGMIEVLEGKRARTPHFLRFPVSLDGAIAGIASPAVSAWLDTEIRTRHGYLSFQQADKIADAIRLISAAELWNELGTRLGQTPKDLKNRLQLIVERRNKIAHEADIDPSFPGVTWPIAPADAASATDFVEQICETIHVVVV
ncbi:HEPN domain-containing protein [Gemmata sp.]|uniref:HEPN domain-containing protein n=1 Tax=Gemmata sp. TaxID=1914242 RepID=UPI003F722147